MKCKNCGGDYRTMKLVCPYCGTENLLGRIWMVERSQAEQDLIRAKWEKGQSKWTIYDVDRIMNRIAAILGLASIAIFIILFIITMVTDLSYSRESKEPASIEVMEAYYQADQEDKLYEYLNVHLDTQEVDGSLEKGEELRKKYKEYSIYAYQYGSYQEHQAELKKELRDYLRQPDENHLKWVTSGTKLMLYYCWNVMRTIDSFQWIENPETIDKLNVYIEEVKVFCKTSLGLTDAELEQLDSVEDYDEIEALEESLAQKLINRRYWETWNF